MSDLYSPCIVCKRLVPYISCKRKYCDLCKREKDTRAWAKGYYERNREKVRSYQAKWREKNPERVESTRKAWVENNKERITLQRTKRRESPKFRRIEKEKNRANYLKNKLKRVAASYNISEDEYAEITKCCDICGYACVVDLHHVDGDHDNATNYNLIGLCPNHHQEIHRLGKTLREAKKDYDKAKSKTSKTENT